VRLTDGSWAVVAVTDTGPGLSPDAIRALHTTKPDPALGPIGPGLTMGELRLIAESLGGALWHDRAAGGTRMVLALPVR
jgi:signal transduction histidine kinase